MPYFFYLIDYSIPICRLLLYSLSVLISVTMSLPEERPSFKDPSSPIGRVQSGLAASILFESGNNVQANLPNNNINKGKWTEEEHKIFMQEYRLIPHSTRWVLIRIHNIRARCVLIRIHEIRARCVLIRIHKIQARCVLIRIHDIQARCVLMCIYIYEQK